VTSLPFTGARILPVKLGCRDLSSTSSVDDDSVFYDDVAAETVGNGHVINMAAPTNFRLPNGITPRDSVESESSIGASRNKAKNHYRHYHHHHQQQQQQEESGQQNLLPQNCSLTVSSTEKTRLQNDNFHYPTYHNQQKQQTEKLQNKMTMTGPALKNLNVISSTEKTPTVTRDQLHQAVENHQHHHCHQQQQQQQQTETLQTLNLKSLKTLNTTSSKDKSPAVMHDPRAAENRHRLHHNQQQQLQQERQQNATSKNWNDPDSTVQQLVTGNTSAAGLPAQTRSRRLPPATNNSLLQSPLGTYKTLHRTPTVGDGPPKSEGKMSMSMTGPMQDSSSNYVASTLPRTIKFQTNGDVRQQRPQHPVFPQTQSGTVRLRTNGEACQQRQQQQQPSHFQAGVHVHQTPYINRLNPDCCVEEITRCPSLKTL